MYGYPPIKEYFPPIKPLVILRSIDVIAHQAMIVFYNDRYRERVRTDAEFVFITLVARRLQYSSICLIDPLWDRGKW